MAADAPNRVNPSSTTTGLEWKWPNGQRLYWAFRLARDVEACADLIAGQSVDPARIDKKALAEAEKPRLVQLTRPIDLVEGRAA